MLVGMACGFARFAPIGLSFEAVVGKGPGCVVGCVLAKWQLGLVALGGGVVCMVCVHNAIVHCYHLGLLHALDGTCA